jgi:hypothetical protein
MPIAIFIVFIILLKRPDATILSSIFFTEYKHIIKYTVQIVLSLSLFIFCETFSYNLLCAVNVTAKTKLKLRDTTTYN